MEGLPIVSECSNRLEVDTIVVVSAPTGGSFG